MEQILLSNRDKEHASMLNANGACVGFGLHATGFESSRLKSLLKTWTLTWLYYEFMVSNSFMFGWFLFPVICFSLKLSNEEMKRAIMTMDEQEDLPKDMLEQVCTMENYNCKKT